MERHDLTAYSALSDPLDWEDAGPASRARLFAVLGWAGAGFVGVAVLAALVALWSETLFQEVGLRSAGGSVAVGLAVFAGVAWCALQMTWEHRTAAQVLLWSTALVYAVLVNVFVAALDIADGQAGPGLFLFVLGSILLVGAGVLCVLGMAVAIGFEGGGQGFFRWLALLMLVAGPVVYVAPDAWWVGVIGGLLLAWAVDEVVSVALRHPDVPGPALAACLVAVVSAVVLLVIFLVVRFVLRVVADGLEGWSNASP